MRAAGFIALAMAGAGRRSEKLFTRNAIKRIAAASGGNPRQLSVVAGAALLVACDNGSQSVSEEAVDEALVDLGGVRCELEEDDSRTQPLNLEQPSAPAHVGYELWSGLRTQSVLLANALSTKVNGIALELNERTQHWRHRHRTSFRTETSVPVRITFVAAFAMVIGLFAGAAFLGGDEEIPEEQSTRASTASRVVTNVSDIAVARELARLHTALFENQRIVAELNEALKTERQGRADQLREAEAKIVALEQQVISRTEKSSMGTPDVAMLVAKRQETDETKWHSEPAESGLEEFNRQMPSTVTQESGEELPLAETTVTDTISIEEEPKLLAEADDLNTTERESTNVDVQSQTSTYTVKRGDTLFEISERFRVEVEVLQCLNQLENPGLLREGQQLVILAPHADPSPAQDVELVAAVMRGDTSAVSQALANGASANALGPDGVPILVFAAAG